MSNTLGSPLPKYASVEFPSAATGYKDKETEGYYIEDGRFGKDAIKAFEMKYGVDLRGRLPGKIKIENLTTRMENEEKQAKKRRHETGQLNTQDKLEGCAKKSLVYFIVFIVCYFLSTSAIKSCSSDNDNAKNSTEQVDKQGTKSTKTSKRKKKNKKKNKRTKKNTYRETYETPSTDEGTVPNEEVSPKEETKSESSVVNTNSAENESEKAAEP